MRRCEHVVALVVLLVPSLLGVRPSSAQTPDAPQDMALATHAPRFLERRADARPVEVTASSSALLRRVVNLELAQPTVGRLLAAIERQTGVRFAFKEGVLPLDRAVTLEAHAITVGGALLSILMDTGVDVLLSGGMQVALVQRASVRVPVSTGTIVGRVTDAKTHTALAGATVVVEGTSHSATTGNDGRYRIKEVAPGSYTLRARYIGYAPGTAPVTVSADQETTADLALEKSVQRLDEVVTTGMVVPTEVKALPTPISVITGTEIQERGYQRVDQIFRGDVPGATAWDSGPFNYTSNIAVRGASALTGTSVIKTFIDGVEVSNPAFVAMIDPSNVDRIEITRGPQASTLYGSGALNGVMQIFTKKGELGLPRPEVTGKLSVGGIAGYDGRTTALQSDNAAGVLGGSANSSYNVGGSYRHTGEWMPSYRSTDWGVSTGGQTRQGPVTLSASARYADKTLDYPWDTRLQSYAFFSQPQFLTQRVREQAYGATAVLQPIHNWSHTLTLGYDQIHLTSLQTQARFITPDDSLLSAYLSLEGKTSLFYHTDLTLQLGTAAVGIVTVGADYEAFESSSSYTAGTTRTTGGLDGQSFVSNSPSSSTGYFGQMQVNLAEQLFLTAGLRAERGPDFGAGFGTAWSPRFGAAYSLRVGPGTVKFRGSYGESIRAPAPGLRDPSRSASSIQVANPDLAPERQRGFDGGVDMYLGRASLGVTYYSQRAVDLIQQVFLPASAGGLVTYQWQNLSRVKNCGWEFEARVRLGPAQLTGTYSITNSTVQELPPDYPAGGYQVGDRVINVPRTTAGIDVTYSPLPKTTLTAHVTHIGHWIGTDYLALYGYFFGGQPYRGSDRAYWIEYPAVTKFGIGVNQTLRSDLTAFVRVENVGNSLRSEQDNTQVSTPRSVLAGVNVRY